MYRLVALGRDADTQVDHVDDDRLVLAPSLTWEPDADTSVTFQALHQRDRSGSTAQFFPWEGTVGPNPNGHIPTDRFIGGRDDRYDSDRSEAGVLLSHRVGDALTLRHATRYSRNDVEYFSLYADAFSNPGDSYLDPARRVLGRYGFFEDRRSKVLGSDTHVEYRLATGALQHQLLLGADYARHRSDAASAFDFTVGLGGGVPNIDVFDPQPAPYTPRRSPTSRAARCATRACTRRTGSSGGRGSSPPASAATACATPWKAPPPSATRRPATAPA